MRKHAVVTIIFVFLAIGMTFPLAFKLNTHIPGFFSSDESYAPVWNAWWLKFCLLNNLSVEDINFLAYPFGIKYYVFGYLFFAINYIFAILTNPMLTYNLQVLINFFLSAIFTYLLVYHLIQQRAVAFLSGIIFGFCPYIFARSWQHLGETYLWMMPMVLWVLFELKDKSTFKLKIFFIISIFLTAISFNTIYYTGVIIATFLVYFIMHILIDKNRMPAEFVKRDIKYLRRIFLLGVVASLFLSTQIYPFIKNAISSRGTKASAFNPYHRSFDDLFTQSAKPLSYLLPATAHPILGRFTEQFIGSPLYGVSYTEHSLYLGWTTLILAFIAFRRWRRARKLKIKNEKLKIDERENFYIGFLVWLALVTWLFSQPPYFTFPYFKIYMPSFFMYKILPMFRAYCRFGIVVMLAVSVLAGFGLKFILEGFRSNRAKVIFTSFVCGLVLFEFLNFPPFKVVDLTKYSKVYDWLKQEEGDFVIAEYPLDTKGPNEYYKFCQTIHEKKMINGTIPGTYANKVARAIWRLSDSQTPQILSWMKVKYVLAHLDAYEKSNEADVVDEFNKVRTKKINGLKFIRSFDNIDVYEVAAEPKEPEINE